MNCTCSPGEVEAEKYQPWAWYKVAPRSVVIFTKKQHTLRTHHGAWTITICIFDSHHDFEEHYFRLPDVLDPLVVKFLNKCHSISMVAGSTTLALLKDNGKIETLCFAPRSDYQSCLGNDPITDNVFASQKISHDRRNRTSVGGHDWNRCALALGTLRTARGGRASSHGVPPTNGKRSESASEEVDLPGWSGWHCWFRNRAWTHGCFDEKRQNPRAEMEPLGTNIAGEEVQELEDIDMAPFAGTNVTGVVCGSKTTFVLVHRQAPIPE